MDCARYIHRLESCSLTCNRFYAIRDPLSEPFAYHMQSRPLSVASSPSSVSFDDEDYQIFDLTCLGTTASRAYLRNGLEYRHVTFPCGFSSGASSYLNRSVYSRATSITLSTANELVQILTIFKPTLVIRSCQLCSPRSEALNIDIMIRS